MIRFWQNDLAKIAHIFSTFSQHIFFTNAPSIFFPTSYFRGCKNRNPFNGKIDTFAILKLKTFLQNYYKPELSCEIDVYEERAPNSISTEFSSTWFEHSVRARPDWRRNSTSYELISLFFFKSIIIAHYILFEQYLNTPFVSPFHTGQIRNGISSSKEESLFMPKCGICKTDSAEL